MKAWGLSDVGNVRTQNQDAYSIEVIKDHCILAIVCDGMGGAKSGDIASREVLNVFSAYVRPSFKPGMNEGQIEAMLRKALDLANNSVYEMAHSNEDYAGMGTTLVAALIYDGTAYVINVGDSRAYLKNQHGIKQITKDHSLVQVMVDRGEITEADARQHPKKNMITRAVGTETAVQGDMYCIPFSKEDNLLLCTDGLSNIVAEQEMLFEIVHGKEKKDCCSRLLDIAKKRGAPDNVTAVLVEG